jgi:hypothetical protein
VDQLEATGRLPVIPPPDRPPGGRRSGRLLRFVAVAAVAVAVVVALFLVDTNAHKGKVGRKVTLGGRSVAGLRPAALDQAVADLATRYRDATVVVDAEGGGFQASAAEIGLSVVGDRTAADALAVGRRGLILDRMWSWARSFFVERKAPVAITVDQAAMDRIVAARDPQRTAPVEPSLVVKDDKMAAKAGEPGRGISPPSVLAALRKAGPAGLPLRISVSRDALPPRYSLADAQDLADRAERLAAPGLPVTAGSTTAVVPAPTLRGWFRADPGDDGLELAVDASGAPDQLAKLFSAPAVAPVDAGFTVSGGKVSITPAKAGSGCCGPTTPAVLQAALLNRAPDGPPVSLPLIQGQVIEPGATFSINDFVGRRTVEKGFVDAPIIDEHYNFASDIGGGISQFATTIFNAAFFSGLDIPSYFMHGIYISRYPYGRESTISYPGPDVRIRNNTPYGVLIWPTYTDTSITVTMYSTKYVSGDQTGQTTQMKGVCTAVTTERTRTYLDGRKTVDHFSGLYSPAEGVECP